MTVCIKIEDDELDSVRALMTMTLHALISDLLRLEPQALGPGYDLRSELAKDRDKEERLQELLREYFDGVCVDFRQIDTLDDLCRQVTADQRTT